ncbi:MAG: gluconokinase [bacterium]
MPDIPAREAVNPLILTIDIGTSSTRTMVFDGMGRSIRGAESRIPYAMKTTADGGVEADGGEMFEVAVQCIDGAIERIGELARNIAGVATCTLASTVLGVDKEGNPVTPVYTYADTRSSKEVLELKGRLDEDEIHDRTGCPLHTSYLPPRFLWLGRAQPNALRHARWWMSIGEYILLRLLGRRQCSYSIASWSGLLNRRKLEWDNDLILHLPIFAEQLSPLGDMDRPLSGLRGEFAERWPALKDVSWFPALGDGVCSNIGSGCSSRQRIAINLGTSGAMRAVVEGDGGRIPQGLWGYRVDGQRTLIGGSLSNGGNVLMWLRETLNLGDPKEIERQISDMKPDGHGLTVLPFLAGERSPGWVAEARAAIVGMSLNTRPVDILRASLEAVAYRFALIYELLAPILAEAKEIVASGGAFSLLPAWMQILADVLGRPVIASGEAEATSRGAALMALRALGELKSFEDAPPSLKAVYEPNRSNHEIYGRALERHRRAYELLIGRREM